MKFLSKLAQLITKGVAIWTGFAPLIQAALPGQSAAIVAFSAELASLADIVVTVELAGQALGIKGPDKLKMAIPLFAQAFLKSSLLAHHDIGDEVLFMQGVTKVADGTADIVNSLKDKIELTDKQG